jgi:hypothetical protein
MSVAQSVAEVFSKHVASEVESIDRMYINVYVPTTPSVEGTLKFIRIHRGHKVASHPHWNRFHPSTRRNIPHLLIGGSHRLHRNGISAGCARDFGLFPS